MKLQKISYAAPVRKGNSKTNLFWKKSNTNILISSDKSSSNENNETPISQQKDLRQRQQEVKKKKSDIEIPQTTKNKNISNYKEMEKQIQSLTSELNHLKNNQNNVTTLQSKIIHYKKAKRRPHRQVCYHLANNEYFKEVKTHHHKLQKTE